MVSKLDFQEFFGSITMLRIASGGQGVPIAKYWGRVQRGHGAVQSRDISGRVVVAIKIDMRVIILCIFAVDPDQAGQWTKIVVEEGEPRCKKEYLRHD